MRALSVDLGHRFESSHAFGDALAGFLYSFAPRFSSMNLAHLVRELFREELAQEGREMAVPPSFLEELAIWRGTDMSPVQTGPDARAPARQPQPRGTAVRTRERQPHEPGEEPREPRSGAGRPWLVMGGGALLVGLCAAVVWLPSSSAPEPPNPSPLSPVPLPAAPPSVDSTPARDTPAASGPVQVAQAPSVPGEVEPPAQEPARDAGGPGKQPGADGSAGSASRGNSRQEELQSDPYAGSPRVEKPRAVASSAPSQSAQADRLVAEGMRLMRSRQFRTAVQFFEQCLALVPDHADCLAYSGSAHARLGEMEEGAKRYRRFVEKYPQDPRAARVRILLRQYDEESR